MSRTHNTILLAGISLLALAVNNALAAPASDIKQAAEQAAKQRYIIKYKDEHQAKAPSAADSKALKQALLSSQSQMLSRQGAKVHHVLSRRNAIAADLNDATVQLIKVNPAVQYIERDLPRYPMSQQVPYGYTMVQADQVSDQFASNQTVCVIDSGLGLPHEDFNDANITGSNDIGTGNWFDAGGPHGHQ